MLALYFIGQGINKWLICYGDTAQIYMMTLSGSCDDQLPTTTDILDGSSSNWDALYCSHLWSNSNLRRAIINAPSTESKVIKYCYTCKGKIRKYEIKSPRDGFIPNNHSTPNGKITIKDIEVPINEPQDNPLHDNINNHALCSNRNSITDIDIINVETSQCIPSISRQIDSSIRHKYTSFEMRPNEINRRRLRKSLKGVGCFVNFSLTDSPVKKRTQIQACSISVMIVAIVVISFVLVNFTTPSFTRATNVVSTIVVPTENLDLNETSSAISSISKSTVSEIFTTDYMTTTETIVPTTENISLISNIISKIRKNIRTYPRDSNKQDSLKPKDIINRDLSQKFCSCQTNEVCMLDENSGTSICRQAVDVEDPTGCGGLCAMETEACQVVDRARGVRVCRLLTQVICSSQEWRCRNGLCVAAEARCDGSIQCYDRSDELHCECDLTKQFRCGHSISCFSNTKLCDGIIDCWDGFDEVNCTTECPEDQFTCTDGQCILPTRFCDGLADCADGSDEPQGCGGACGAHEVRCDNHRCVPLTMRCDGRDDCGDNTDELHCS